MTHNHGSTIQREALALLCGDRIGGGVSREVYECDLMPEAVVKVEDGAGSFQNVMEWETWERVRGTDYEKWFAPCLHISPCGAILIMARTTPAARYPKKLPVFLTDTKYANYGMLKGRFVCHDYGYHLLMERGMSKRKRRADWWR